MSLGNTLSPTAFGWLPASLQWLPKMSGRDWRADFLAGLTGAVIGMPQGVAFAMIAGMPPEYGLYAGMVPAIIAAFFGSSRHLVSGPTTTSSVVLYSALSLHAAPDTPAYVTLALTLTFMIGVLKLVLGLVRLGSLTNFISQSVIVGFTAGAAILIAVKQIRHFFGVHMDSTGNFAMIIYHFSQHIREINPYATLVAVATLLAGVAGKRWLSRFPYMVTAILAGSLLSLALNALFGAGATHIEMVGALPASLPPLSMPDLSLENIRALAPASLAVTLLSLTEAVSIGRAIAARSGYHINSNQEFIGQGLSNLVGSFFSGYGSTGSFNRTAVNYEAGARTPMAAVFAGVLLMFATVVAAPLTAYLPKAAMGGMLFLVAWGLFGWQQIREILRFSRRDTAVMVVSFLSALFLDLEFAIFVGLILALVLYLERVSRPKLVMLTPDRNLPNRSLSEDSSLPQCPQFRMVRVDGSLFFGSVNYLQESFEKLRTKYAAQTHLALLCDGINFADLQGGKALHEEAILRHKLGGDLYLINVKDGLWDPLQACGCFDDGEIRNVFQSKQAAIHAIYQKLDKSVCATCTRRIFQECGPLPKPVENAQGNGLESNGTLAAS